MNEIGKSLCKHPWAVSKVHKNPKRRFPSLNTCYTKLDAGGYPPSSPSSRHLLNFCLELTRPSLHLAPGGEPKLSNHVNPRKLIYTPRFTQLQRMEKSEDTCFREYLSAGVKSSAQCSQFGRKSGSLGPRLE